MDIISLNDIELLTARKIGKVKAEKSRILPYRLNGSKVEVLCETRNESVAKELQFLYGLEVNEIIISKENLDFLIDKIFFTQDNKEIEEVIVREAVNLHASDLHFEPCKECVYIRIRIDGTLSLFNIITREEYSVLNSRIKIKSSLDITEHRKPQDGKFSFNVLENTYDLRVSIIPVVFGEKIVLRILYNDNFQYSLENLKLLKEQNDKLEKIISRNTGLVIVNGPTGSGKSTTLYTILNHINNSKINVVTLEDPVEVIINGINQMKVNTKEGIGFADGLRSIMRQDPDVIMVGEIRDEETAAMSVRAALTGHKVYTTIHCKDPREVYLRLEEMGVKSYLIRDSLVGVVSQRLIKLLCEECKDKEEIIYENKKVTIAKRGAGCKKCNFTGYSGRALVVAVNEISREVKKSLINLYENDQLLSNKQMINNLNELLLSGQISRLDYIEFIDKEDLDYNYESTFGSET